MHIDPNMPVTSVVCRGGHRVLEHPIGPETEPASFKNEEHGQCFGDVP